MMVSSPKCVRSCGFFFSFLSLSLPCGYVSYMMRIPRFTRIAEGGKNILLRGGECFNIYLQHFFCNSLPKSLFDTVWSPPTECLIMSFWVIGSSPQFIFDSCCPSSPCMVQLEAECIKKTHFRTFKYRNFSR